MDVILENACNDHNPTIVKGPSQPIFNLFGSNNRRISRQISQLDLSSPSYYISLEETPKSKLYHASLNLLCSAKCYD